MRSINRNISLLGMICWIFTLHLHAFEVDIRIPKKKPESQATKNPVITPYMQKKILPKPIKPFFVPTEKKFHHSEIATNPLHLQQAAIDALNYIHHNHETRQHVISPTDFDTNIFSLDEVKKTLRFIISTIEADKKTGKFRILDPTFIHEKFDCIKWHGDTQSAQYHNQKFIKNKQIRLTHYVIYKINGSPVRTKEFPYALYELHKSAKSPTYTKHQILRGALENKCHQERIKPLVWVSREGLEDAIMQGQILITMPDEKIRMFSIHQNNNIKYDKQIKDPMKQQRYWYFREIDKKYVNTFVKRLMSRKNVIFAGDIFNIGLGKIIAIQHKNPKTQKPELRLGVLADTGNAFSKNIYQLDFFGGVFSCKKALNSYIQNFTNTVDAYILKMKEPKLASK